MTPYSAVWEQLFYGDPENEAIYVEVRFFGGGRRRMPCVTTTTPHTHQCPHTPHTPMIALPPTTPQPTQ